MFDLTLNEESLSVNLDLINELRDKRKIREATCKLSGNKTLQHECPTEELPKGRPRLENEERRKEKMKASSHPIGKGLSGSEKMQLEGAYHLEWLPGKNVLRT